MRCARVQQLLPLHAGGDLAERKATQVARHIETCPDCRRAEESYAAALGALREAGAKQAPAGDWAECWLGIQARLHKVERAPRAIRLPGRSEAARWLKAAAMLLVALGVGIAIGWGAKSPGGFMGLAGGHVATRQGADPPAADPAHDGPFETVAVPLDKAVPDAARPGPARKIFVIDEVVTPGVYIGQRVPGARSTTVVPVVSPAPRRGYYMDNIELIGARRKNR